ncbi:ABC transporter substrate-binding protein [Vibrio ostreicida]|uniref:ABC transporter substrate-binding protein n=1 Tax=Vibrio ostreicida TaxID=526588 RepID=A0ABT8BUC4_9VIBR|nr:ABC transporter substrate-binding protein [Vibrio ostreicida]MDN3610377.1 ABC transporter substrate-binding protein [Vibrio ostreicida]NPD07612.1 oligopeptide ABC transporter substrate-binding protein OppA [Vibrio ostreicida]
MYKNTITRALLVSAGLSLALTGCGEKPEEQQTSQTDSQSQSTELAAVQELVRGNGTEVASLDPHKVEGVPESHVLRDLMEGLVIQDALGNTIPGVAESWTTDDNQTFTFTIRKDAKWSNGEPVTAHDFEYSFKRVTDPMTASPYAWFVEYTKMKNAKDIIAGKKDVSELGVKAIDDHTLVLETELPLPHFVKMMAHTTMYPVNKAVVEKFGDDWTKPGNFVGNGAYVLSEWVVNEKIVAKRNEYYWDNKDTTIDKVTYLPIENQNAEMNRFLSGEIHMTYEVPNEQFRRLVKEYPQNVVVSPNLCTYYYGFNTQRAPFDDVRVRKALSYAIDRDVVTNAILGQGQQPAYSLTHSGITGFAPDAPEYALMDQTTRVDKAIELLADAGFGKENPLDFTLLYNTSENHKKIAVAVQSMWKKSLGDYIDVSLENQEWKTYLESSKQGDFDVRRAGWCADYNEASTFLAIGMTENGSNDQKYSSTIFDKAMQDAVQVAKTEAERNNYYAIAEAQLAKDMPLAPIYQYVQPRLISTHLGGYPEKNPEDNIYSKDMYITK